MSGTTKLTPVQDEIRSEIGRAVEKLGGNFELLALIGSWGDTLPDEDIRDMLRDFNEHGTAIKEVICCIEG